MRALNYILSIDMGSSGPKVALVGEDGSIAARAVRPVETLSIPPDGAEQDPADMWSAVTDAARQVIGDTGVGAESILGVVCESHYFSIIPVDAEGEALMNCVMWMDQRGAPNALELYGRHPDTLEKWIEVHGLPPIPSGNDSLSHILFIKSQRPDVYERTHAFVEPMDYLVAKLTGTVAANACTVFPLLLTDNRTVDSISYDDELVSRAGVDPEKLPVLRPLGEPVGTIRPEVAESLGLSSRAKVFAGMNDTQAIGVGAGTFRPGQGGINIGTTTQVLAHVDSMSTDLASAILSMPSAIPGRYMAMAENGLGGKLLEHFVLNVVFSKDAFADHSTEDAYRQVEAVVASEAAGSGGLLFLPWLTGLQSPVIDPSARGGFLNMSLSTTRSSMMRAIVEGITFNMRWLLPSVERFCGHEFEELRFSGGGAVFDEWSRILADVMSRPVLQVADARYLNARAAAFLAFIQEGLSDLDQVESFCPIKARYEPREENRDTYASMFEQFSAAYERNRPIFEALNAGVSLSVMGN